MSTRVEEFSDTEGVVMARRHLYNIRRRSGHIGRYLVLISFAFLAVAPILWLLLVALRPSRDAMAVGIDFDSLSWANFSRVFTEYDFQPYFENSTIIALSTVILVAVVSVPAAYSLQRFKLPGFKSILLLLLLVKMIPMVALTIPLFTVFAQFDLLNTVIALIIVQTAAKLPVATWLTRGFVESVPTELEESAHLDGANHLQILTRVIVPLVAPGVAAAAVLTFLFTWNDLLVALTLTSNSAAQTLPVAMTKFVGLYGIDWGPMAAGGILMIVPSLIFIFFAQRHLVNGLLQGAVK